MHATEAKTCPYGVLFKPNSNAQAYCTVRCRNQQHCARSLAAGVCYQCGERLNGGRLCDTCRERHREDSVESNRRLRLEAITAYGGKCACPGCQETRLEFLAIDHIDGGGNKHREQIGASNATHFCRWLKKNNFPPGFRVLCHNCNCARGYYDYCPHEREN